MVAPRILAAQSQEAEGKAVEILESLGTLDGEDLKHRQANALKEPIAFSARQSEFTLALAKTVAEQRRDLERLEKKVGESSLESKARVPSQASEATKKGAKS